MCMKNINIIPTFCDVMARSEDATISLGNIGKHFRIEITNDGRVIPQLSMSIFFSALQTKNELSLQELNPEESFDFRKNYDIKIRLTETISGVFKDLDTFQISAAENADTKHLCMSTFNYTELRVYNNISLPDSIPDNNTPEKFVIKILIKLHKEDSTNTANDKWIVQAIVPISFDS